MLLKNHLIKIMKEKGPIRFDDYMRLCLYHPQYGYYTTGRVSFGKRGDFYTAPMVHSLFGYTLADFYMRESETLGKWLHPVEIGAGEGQLALDFMERLRTKYPEIFRKTTYTIIEKSPILVKRQQDKMKKLAILDKYQWQEEFQGGTVFLLSNELYDSFPVRRFKITAKPNLKLQEIYLRVAKGNFIEIFQNCQCPEIIQVIKKWNLAFEEELYFELSQEAGIFLSEIVRKMIKGTYVIIDYGDEYQRLLSSHSRATVRGYSGHTVVDLYEKPGETDLTASVNFTYLREVAQESGAQKTTLLRQNQFLLNEGIVDIMQVEYGKKDDEEFTKAKRSLNTLLHPEIMGDIFKVLIIRKN